MSEILEGIQEAQSHLADISQAVAYAERALEQAENAAENSSNSNLADSLRSVIGDLEGVKYELPDDGTEVGSVVRQSEDAWDLVQSAITTLENLADEIG